MTYCIYHIPGKKIGVTINLEERVTNQQGYDSDEYEILEMSDDIEYISFREHELQEKYGYKVDRKLYMNLKPKTIEYMKMKINVTEQTTTFPCPVNKLKGQLMDAVGMGWDTEHGACVITPESINWILKNAKKSMYNDNRCYVYNKAFCRWFDNNDAFSVHDQYNGKTRTGALAPTGVRCKQPDCEQESLFDCIRQWAEDRGLYDKGDVKTQTLKLMEEAGEICKATLKQDREEVIDGIGDCVVVLTNLAHLHGVTIEDCMQAAYDVISKRTGKMVNGTFKKD